MLYCLKIWLFHDQFKLTAHEAKGVKDFCIFAVSTYLKTWMTASLASSAPRNDLELMKAVLKYEVVNPGISSAVATKLTSHLWYLSEEMTALALFDRDIDGQTKRQLVRAIKEGMTIHQREFKSTLTLLQRKRLQTLSLSIQCIS